MGPKIKFTREQIIDAAFEIARAEGIDNVTMRKIAHRMGSSVAPIYVNFKSINELIEALIEKIADIGQQLIAEENTGSPFADIGRASIRFAMEYSVLFRDLVMKNSRYLKGYDEKVMPALIEEMKKDSDLEGFSEDKLKEILLKMRIFQLGLSVMAASGILSKDYDMKDLTDLLSSTADDVILSARLK
ncbi:MAG TPA: TetR/AcrR family transcriptional regulator [Bacillota bacterium]|nr:TetR/AcrR family transcriptional regulator [Clostridiaceae bacterium]HNT02906.1 TetR/AcrR family transcriptional regulator [Bacillota bacterium]HPA54539.1 TetR/AcrR family transcriptional regulator [Bacillota bacterium]HPX69593.1 TetR/AcrR family transcriptional regulator [Bacillota bacterium]HQA65319.1 TetR/AcrR family transcriptional regulator [Bacillota bacterium]